MLTITSSTQYSLRLLILSALVWWAGSAVAEIILPKAAEVCPNTWDQKAYFVKWWGRIKDKGSVDPPNNLTSVLDTNCDFYMAAERIFLWLTSPVRRDNLHVFEMPIFYQVSPADQQNARHLLANSADLNKPNPKKPEDLIKLKKASVSITQFDMAGNAVVLDSNGKVYSFVRQEMSESGAPLIRNRDGSLVEIERTKVAPDGAPLFLDKSGRPIPFSGKPIMRDFSGKPIEFDSSFKKFFRNGQPFFLDQSGKVIATERGAGSQSVLMAQARKKLVYYTIEVNDVYAYFLTGTKTILPGSTKPAIGETHFPVKTPDLGLVESFAGVKFPHPQVLTIAIKLAWIEAAGLRNVGSYITTWANIPKYDEADPSHWVRNGWRPAKLALVGVHIAFGAKDHKELVWATFEHINNAANPAYCYKNDQSKLKINPPSNGVNWLFSSVKRTGRNRNVNCEETEHKDVNIQHMYLHGDDIYAFSGDKIKPTDVLRIHPWGFRLSEATAANNSEIIDLNNKVNGKLPRGDARRNYVIVGATWEGRGNASQEGAAELANTTMETFFQGMKEVNQKNQMKACLGCHQGSDTNMLGSPNGGVSHIYCVTSPLSIPGSTSVTAPGCGGDSRAPAPAPIGPE